MPIRRFLVPHRIRELLSCCPPNVTEYAVFQLDSIAKILNHVLALTLVFNVFLFFASWKVASLPSVGANAVLIAFLLCAQTAAVFLILNSGWRIQRLSFLAPTDFLLGVALGITVGGTILAFVLSGTFRSVSRCRNVVPSEDGGDSAYEDMCANRKMALTAIWFWSGLVFWLNCVSALLLAMGRYDLSANTSSYVTQQYESLDTTEQGQSQNDNYSYQDQGQPGGGGGGGSIPGDMPPSTP